MMDALAAAVPVEIGAGGLPRRRPPGSSMTTTEYGGEGHSTGAVYAALHIAGALVQLARTGEGCEIDVSAADAVIANAWVGATYSLNADRIVDRGSIPADELGPKYSFYGTADDRFVLFCCIEAKFWDSFCMAVERSDLLERRQASSTVDYGQDDEALRQELAMVFRGRTQVEWIELAARLHLPIGPALNDPTEFRQDPHLSSREILLEREHPEAGLFTYVGQPAIITGQPYEIERHAPAHGQHTDEVLCELGYDDRAIAELRDAAVIL
jgi:crotonobetainyl-CoA:carnitine CoA-transferase CaiB-like acyl-CoA transferase